MLATGVTVCVSLNTQYSQYCSIKPNFKAVARMQQPKKQGLRTQILSWRLLAVILLLMIRVDKTEQCLSASVINQAFCERPKQQRQAELGNLIDRLDSSIQRQCSTKVVKHTPDIRLTIVRLESQVLRHYLWIQIKYYHLTLKWHTYTRTTISMD